MQIGYLSLLFALVLCSCGPAQPEAPSHESSHAEGAAGDHHDDHDEHHGDEHHDEEGGVHLTAAQVENMDIKLGDFSQLKLNDYLSATGVLGLPPNAYIAVNARANGFVHNVPNYVEGDFVRKGAVLGYLENPEFIDHQQRFLEVSAELAYLRQELERQETLLAADAGILKSVQRLRSEVAGKTATLAGISQRLEYLGIRTADITPENLTDRITLFAPRSGYITTISLHDGLYVEPSTELIELIDEDHLHLELEVFERDIARVEKGQRVTYRIPALGTQTFAAEIHVIGKEFNTENKTVRVHAHLQGEQPPFVEGRFAEARIWLDDQTVSALPEAAVLYEGEMAYVYISPADTTGDEVGFERLTVNPGITDNGFTAVRLIDPLPPGMRIVTEGAYYVNAQEQAGALEHKH
ncbi:cobalt-zinc-cadmium efflux system membrane fusion protein [Lewinella aquimaris]|uniref:Cobalt-zinc-cadmium efflux system membrane fusion protein n=1 Tax=Neolewinella aquimaris TaxID=1835722 RepID=A0A840E717_9BACT|nr:efflux RND transporter periplasmic adaptor subunit [Neolewinella aquimaris]MBB4079415.1 cobalt-zinc-cadmium efflux system membrane fusion protein [Neolewinella aquimaris]